MLFIPSRLTLPNQNSNDGKGFPASPIGQMIDRIEKLSLNR